MNGHEGREEPLVSKLSLTPAPLRSFSWPYKLGHGEHGAWIPVPFLLWTSCCLFTIKVITRKAVVSLFGEKRRCSFHYALHVKVALYEHQKTVRPLVREKNDYCWKRRQHEHNEDQNHFSSTMLARSATLLERGFKIVFPWDLLL